MTKETEQVLEEAIKTWQKIRVEATAARRAYLKRRLTVSFTHSEWLEGLAIIDEEIKRCERLVMRASNAIAAL